MPDLLLYNGKLHTQDSRFPEVSAIALRENRILAVGADQAIRGLAAPDTEQIDLQGRLVLPGLTDAHFHYYDWALGLKRLALGTDCPVASPNPFWNIRAAVTRQGRDGTPEGGWYPSQRLSVSEAVWGYTMGPALASGREHAQGSLSPGKLADLVVLDRDIFEIPTEEIPETKVGMTVFDGRIVHRR